MNGTFEVNCLKPGDKDFVWDKQVEFAAPTAEGGDWDSEEED
jgi:hypothetical protein